MLSFKIRTGEEAVDPQSAVFIKQPSTASAFTFDGVLSVLQTVLNTRIKSTYQQRK